LSTTNTTSDPGSNPGRRDGKPAINCLSYGAALGTGLTTKCSVFFLCDAVQSGIILLAFRRNVLPPSSGPKIIQGASSLLGWLFYSVRSSEMSANVYRISRSHIPRFAIVRFCT
jgi:hypothetical protein